MSPHPRKGAARMSLDIDVLLSELTLEEKASLTSGSSFWYTAPVERLGIPRIMVSDGPHGLRAQPGEGDHVGLGGSLPATCFPTASAVASTWNPDLLRRIGEALALEARACNLSVILGPGINMKRSPLCGRNFEYFSEDPFLAGELGVGIVEGIQSGGVGTSVKHYAANNQETDRLRVDAQVDERTLREIYFPAFERIVTACQPWTIMCSYNKVNGLSASENPWLLTTVLREEFGFEGLVVSDWGAVYHRVPARQGRARPGDAAEPAAQPGPGRRGRPRRRAGRAGPRRPGPHRPGAGGQGHGRARAGRGLRRRRPPPPRPGRRRGVGGPAQERGRDSAAGAGEPDRRDRRVRPHAPVPGRGQLPGHPHQGRERPRRADRDVRRGHVRRRVRNRRHRAPTTRCAPRPSRSRRRPTPWSC